MKLTLRPEWRLRPLSSFLGFLDLKTGVTIALLFAVLNKVAGVYGLIAVLTGAGGTPAQLTLYLYSVLGLIGLVWGLRAITREDPKSTLYFAHLFFADHVLSTAWTIFFAVVWWIYTPHDGRKQSNSAAQEEMAKSTLGEIPHMTEEERAYAAMRMWNHEKGMATTVIVLGWISKIYFALLLYSYAVHLRKGSYHSLPTTRQAPVHYQPLHTSTSLQSTGAPGETDVEEEVEDFYRLPPTHPLTPSASSQSQHARTGSQAGPQPWNGNVRTHIRSTSAGGSSVGSFADFVSAPGRGATRLSRAGSSNASGNGRRSSKLNPNAASQGSRSDGGFGSEVDEVLFDEDEFTTGATGTSRSGSGSGSGGSMDEERPGGSGSHVSAHGRRQSRTRR